MDAGEVHAGVENVGQRVAEIADDCVGLLVDGLRVQTVYKHFVRHRNAILFEEVEWKAVSASGHIEYKIYIFFRRELWGVWTKSG